MKNRAVRVILLLLSVAAAGGAGYVAVTVEQQAAVERRGEQIVREQAAGLLALVAELRAGQRGYVATGQNPQFWTARVTSLLVDIEASVRQMRQAVRAEAAAAAVAAAAVAIENFTKLDARAQEYVGLDQPFLASDLIFSDGLEMTSSAAGAIQTALREETQASDGFLRQLRQQQAWAAAGGGAALLLTALVLFPVPGRGTAETEARLGAVALGRLEALDGTLDGTDRRTVIPDDNDGLPEEVKREAFRAAAPPAPALDLATAARLCTELGRVLETSELPPLLVRAAELLDAAGLVVWVRDPSGAELRPVLTHGYGQKIVAQMRSIPRDAQNAAALAFRSAEARIVSGTDLANGAFVAPLLTPSGCVGVFAAELRHGSEKRESTRALALILAAQVATLVGTAPATGGAAAQAQA
jgi:CHASE3 domain sensor protein